MLWYKFWLESRMSFVGFLIMYLIITFAMIGGDGIFDPVDWQQTLNDPEGSYTQVEAQEKSRLQTITVTSGRILYSRLDFAFSGRLWDISWAHSFWYISTPSTHRHCAWTNPASITAVLYQLQFDD